MQPGADLIRESPKDACRDSLSYRSFAQRAQAFLSNRSIPLFAAMLAFVLTIPALGAGWLLDDYYHRAVLLQVDPAPELFGPPAEMFRFFRGDPARTIREMDYGFLPWWTDTEVKAEFLQVLTVLTHRLDYWLWPNSAAAMHVHSLLWFAALVFLTGCLYQRMIVTPWVAGLAALLFAMDSAHGTPAGWIANRNSLVAGCFGVLTLIFHDRFRKDGQKLSGLFAMLAFTAALLTKEEGIATAAYLLAYGLCFDPSGFRRGGPFLVPYLGIVISWRAYRAAAGYGVWNMGFYVDPIDNPTRFLAAVGDRMPILLLGQLGLPPSDLAILLSPTARSILWWGAIAFLILFLGAVATLLRQDRIARFWALGMVLSAIPVSATFPMDRLLTFVGIGAFGLIAQFFQFVLDPSQYQALRAWYRMPVLAMAILLAVVHGMLAPIALPIRAGNPMGPRSLMNRFDVNVPLGPSVREQSVVIVNAPSAPHACYLPIRRAVAGLTVPQHTRVLASGMPSVTIGRPHKNVLTIRPKKGYLSWVADRLFRDRQHPMSVGEKVELTGMTVEVRSLTEDKRPAEAAFHFTVPLEDASLVWLCYRGNGFEPFTPPSVGESVEIRIGGMFSQVGPASK